MPNLFSFVINMLNQIYNDHKKERKTQTENIYIYMYNWNMFRKKRRKKKERVRKGEHIHSFLLSLFVSLSLSSQLLLKRQKARKSKQACKCNSAILFSIRLALKPFYSSNLSFLLSWKKSLSLSRFLLLFCHSMKVNNQDFN